VPSRFGKLLARSFIPRLPLPFFRHREDSIDRLRQFFKCVPERTKGRLFHFSLSPPLLVQHHFLPFLRRELGFPESVQDEQASLKSPLSSLSFCSAGDLDCRNHTECRRTILSHHYTVAFHYEREGCAPVPAVPRASFSSIRANFLLVRDVRGSMPILGLSGSDIVSSGVIPPPLFPSYPFPVLLSSIMMSFSIPVSMGSVVLAQVIVDHTLFTRPCLALPRVRLSLLPSRISMSTFPLPRERSAPCLSLSGDAS